MIGPRAFVFVAAMLVSAGAAAQIPTTQPPAPVLKIGTRVGLPVTSGYDDGGRRDPFVSLVKEQVTVVSATGQAVQARAKGLAGVAINDVAIKGIITSGQKWLAIIAGPDGNMYLAHTDDKLHDGSVRKIDRDSVVFHARVQDGTGKLVSREVRKGIRPSTGESR